MATLQVPEHQAAPPRRQEIEQGASYDIAQTRKRENQIYVRRIHPLAEIPT